SGGRVACRRSARSARGIRCGAALLLEAPRPVLVPQARGLEPAELRHALRARRVHVPAAAAETPAKDRIGLGLWRRLRSRAGEGCFEMGRLFLEQVLDLASAHSDAADVAEDLRGAFVGQVGGKIERLLAHGGGVLGAVHETDPLVERPAYGL